MENNTNQKITTPVAIIVAGVLIMVGILLTKGGDSVNNTDKSKTLSEQVGVNKVEFTKCMEETDLQALKDRTDIDAENAMKGIPSTESRGTPYSVIIGKNGFKTEIRGAYPKESVQKMIAEVNSGSVTNPYDGEINGYQEGDHIIGNPNAPIIIVEYSDLECPYCKKFGDVMKEIVSESNGDVAWIYRHWVVHSTALPKAAAAECVAKIKGNSAFWEYIDLVFNLMDPAPAPVKDNL